MDYINVKMKADKNGNVFFESDMILPRHMVEQAVNSGSMLPEVKSQKSKNGMVAYITAPLFMRWPGGVVPYVIDDDLKCSFLTCLISNPEKHIKNAMRTWSSKTCVSFRPRTSADKDYVMFVNSKMNHCASHVGKAGGMQKIYLGLGCRSDGTIMHEIGHALGFFHEQSRPDRDQYVKINFDNIPRKYWFNFRKYTTGISDMGTPYDYYSIMHYKSTAFVKTLNLFAKSIEPLQPGKTIGQRKELSAIDIKEMNLYYGC